MNRLSTFGHTISRLLAGRA